MRVLLIVIALAAVAAFLWWRQRRPEEASIALPAPRRTDFGDSLSNRYRAVVIRPCRDSCAKARELNDTNRAFLCKDAPKLPLDGCNAARCDCRYEHLPDRRRDSRRAHDQGAAAFPFHGSDRRARSLGRREADQDVDLRI